jgi:hypothetical protein
MYKPAVPCAGEENSFRALSSSNEAIGTDAQPVKYAEATTINKSSIFLNIIKTLHHCEHKEHDLSHLRYLFD